MIKGIEVIVEANADDDGGVYSGGRTHSLNTTTLWYQEASSMCYAGEQCYAG